MSCRCPWSASERAGARVGSSRLAVDKRGARTVCMHPSSPASSPSPCARPSLLLQPSSGPTTTLPVALPPLARSPVSQSLYAGMAAVVEGGEAAGATSSYVRVTRDVRSYIDASTLARRCSYSNCMADICSSLRRLVLIIAQATTLPSPIAFTLLPLLESGLYLYPDWRWGWREVPGLVNSSNYVELQPAPAQPSEPASSSPHVHDDHESCC